MYLIPKQFPTNFEIYAVQLWNIWGSILKYLYIIIDITLDEKSASLPNQTPSTIIVINHHSCLRLACPRRGQISNNRGWNLPACAAGRCNGTHVQLAPHDYPSPKGANIISLLFAPFGDGVSSYPSSVGFAKGYTHGYCYSPLSGTEFLVHSLPWVPRRASPTVIVIHPALGRTAFIPTPSKLSTNEHHCPLLDTYIILYTWLPNS